MLQQSFCDAILDNPASDSSRSYTEQAERAFNVIEKFRHERLHDKMNCSRINFQSTGKRAGTGETVRAVWAWFASAGFTEADVAIVYKLAGCYQKAVAFPLGDDVTVSTAQIRYAVGVFCYTNATVKLTVSSDGEIETETVSATREEQRMHHEELITRFFSAEEQKLVRDLIYGTRELIDRLKSIKNVVKYYQYLLNPAFEISSIAKIHMTVTENAYWFSIRDIGEAQSVVQFLIKSHRKATKRTVSAKGDKSRVKRGTEASISKNQKLKAVSGN